MCHVRGDEQFRNTSKFDGFPREVAAQPRIDFTVILTGLIINKECINTKNTVTKAFHRIRGVPLYYSE